MSTSFVEKFIEFTKESETPTSFWKWGAYAMIAATLRDNVYWTTRGHKMCTNIYVLLNADSATHRKSGPVREASRLLSAVKTVKVIRGRGSIQAILEDLSKGTMDKETGKLYRGGSCLLVADELKSFFVGDDSLVGILTDIYEYRDIFDYKLRGNGFHIKDLCVSLLAASNDEFLKTIYTGEAVYGGLLGRTFIVKANEYRPGNSLLEVEGEEEANLQKYDNTGLIEILKEISKLTGKVRFTIDAKTAYDEWYFALRKAYEKRPDRTGVLGRMHTGVLKLAVILAVSRRIEIIVRRSDILDAISECMSLLPNYDGFAIGIGKSSEAIAGGYLFNELWEAEHNQISRATFLGKYWYDVSGETLDKLIGTLEQAGMIKRGFSGSTEVIVMTEKSKEIYRRQTTNETRNSTTKMETDV